MKLVAICPHDCGLLPTAYHFVEADTIDDAKQKARHACCGSEYVSSIHVVKYHDPHHTGKLTEAAGELVWQEGECYHYVVDDICRLINESFGIKSEVVGKNSRRLFGQYKSDHFATIEVSDDKVSISMALYDNSRDFNLADPDCFDHILDYLDYHRK